VEGRSHDNVPLQEETIVRLEGERAALSQQLAAERSRLGCYEAKWREQEREICDLKSLTVDLKAQLNHGLANLGAYL
jgi:hypothetical protein